MEVIGAFYFPTQILIERNCYIKNCKLLQYSLWVPQNFWFQMVPTFLQKKKKSNPQHALVTCNTSQSTVQCSGITTTADHRQFSVRLYLFQWYNNKATLPWLQEATLQHERSWSGFESLYWYNGLQEVTLQHERSWSGFESLYWYNGVAALGTESGYRMLCL